MKITLLVNHDPAAALALSYLEKSLAAHELSVFFTRKPSRASNPVALQNLAEFEAACLTRDTKVFERLNAKRLNAINTHDFEQFTRSEPDLVISVRHMSILQDAVIAVPRHGIINLHSGILPDYQGVMATFWAMQNRASQIGTSLHWIDSSQIDKGAVITSTQQPVRYEKSYFWNVCNLYAAGCAAIAQTVNQLAEASKPNATPQASPGHYYSYPDHAALAAFAYPLWDANDSLKHWLDS
ncbi:formyl transferase [Arenicella xantha]|uniref:Formyl transferase-like protein n=1 Tax=Arenicella xantha TaxID=644221 RepID=A0A395JHZ8_9GAMM|nr:formyl transferase [Arenicella xantha]RBP49757.1 formyl transferase-like protein [Arenicella xantha]